MASLNTARKPVSQEQTKVWRSWVVVAVCMLFLSPAHSLAQKQEKLPIAGIRIGSMIGNTSLTQDAGSFGRAFFRHSLAKQLYGELDLGYGKIGGDLYSTQLVPLEYRFVIVPQANVSHAAYFYVGAGATNYEIQNRPARAKKDTPNSGWTGHIPIGVGLNLNVDRVAALEFNTGYNFSFTDGLDAVTTGRSDGFWTIEVGISIGAQRDEDPDQDGLNTKEETTLGTDPENPDTDGDGLPDGDEVLKYRTDPLRADTDGDGLSDGEEVLKYHTDPLKADTDGDGLNDGLEVVRYRTDPLKADTDGDGLSDGLEVLKYDSEPLLVDTDGDGLSDGDEVLRFKTNPVNIDSDGGTIPDGIEVKRETNPLDPGDDLPGLEEEGFTMELDKPIVLEGVDFEPNSATLTSGSAGVLGKAFRTLEQNPGIEVEIRGHTDNTGTPSANLKLSASRAEAVKAYLVQRGIVSSRITCKAFASIRPRASNATSEGRQQNRRIEFVRVK